MGDIPNRSELEAELARRFSKLSSQQRKRLLELLGDPPDYGKVPQSFWDDVEKELSGLMTGHLTGVYMDAAERAAEGLPYGVDWALVNTRASRWARQYSYEWVRKINETNRRATQEAISNFFELGQTRGDLENALARIFGPNRASAIAVTETTRASVEGERAIAAELRDQGIEMVEVWLTSNDELVCDICGPRNEKQKGDGWVDGDGPPAHVNCRCDVAFELPKVKG